MSVSVSDGAVLRHAHRARAKQLRVKQLLSAETRRVHVAAAMEYSHQAVGAKSGTQL